MRPDSDTRAGCGPGLFSLEGAGACTLCPRMCKARRDKGERGACGAGAQMAVARAALHFWEEPPLSGERGSGAVFFAHCPLKCVYCQNAAIASGDAPGTRVSAGRLADICLDLQAQGALNVNFVTPTHHALQVREAVRLARGRGLGVPVVWNTSGYERVQAVRALSGTVDVYLADFKYADAGLARRYSKAPDYPDVALRAIQAMVEEAGAPTFDEVDGIPRMTGGVIVRHLLLPGALDNSLSAVKLLHERFGDDVLYSIMNQYTPVMPASALGPYPELGRACAPEDYERLLDFADALGLDDYFWQDGPADAASFIPAWDGTGV